MALDGPGFDRAYREYAPRLRAVAFHVMREREAAEDVVHGALMRAWSSGSYQPERGALLPFLIACVRREALDALRSSKRRAEREIRAVSGERTTFDPIDAVDPIEGRRVAAALARLPDGQREIVLQAYYGGRTLSEIAESTQTPLGTVKSRLSAALRALHRSLSEETR